MKPNPFMFFPGLLLCGIILAGCGQTPKQVSETEEKGTPETQVVLMDYGAQPTVLDIEAYTTANTDFRNTLWTGSLMQATLMSIPPGGEIGLECHPGTDQFLRIEQGQAEVMMGDAPDSLDFRATAGPDFAVFIPAGKWHNLVNNGDTPVKLYSIYTPVEHPKGTVHPTYKEAMEAEHHH